MAIEYDVVILGGGTGGYVAAVRAAQNGLKTAIVEKEKLGGTCLHKGCIPTKALLKSSEVYKTIRNAEYFGIDVEEPVFNLEKVMERKEKIVDNLFKGVKGLVSSADIDIYDGFGRILGPSIFSPMAGSISVEYDDGRENTLLVPKNVILATGSSPRMLPGIPVDGEYVITSDNALNMKKLPSSIIIVGAGVIGIEWASFYRSVGVEVTLIEAGEQILPGFDQDIAKEMSKYLTRNGVKLHTNTSINSESFLIDNGIKVTAFDDSTFNADQLLVAIGRKANISNIGIENTDIQITNDFIHVNQYCQSKESHIYAIGDVNGGKQLAHAATYEANVAVSHITGNSPSLLNETDIPSCVYGEMEIASVGLTEEEARNQFGQVKINRTSMKAIGKAHVNGSTDGFAKIIIDEKTDDIIGFHLIGKGVTELIGQVSLAKYFDGSGLELSESINPHPSLSEVISEAALAAEGRKIHG
ncbi:dihydrolipoamide dehydrogenase [Gracilibacillus ureilyticus]|uniref:Dihydrolipoyl dehydrogenase n=1 Tax=Gracilibacillus ureilyticus TaxID=531814 RepID=A0A1H9LWB7_9BACI|nr:dihydrolipoyl dehydrogenase [Gracilibacillus ureilyticus]SER15507.1 dihydrolipoamide dehydrogenase [Gracilibacillus ureilyticus]